MKLALIAALLFFPAAFSSAADVRSDHKELARAISDPELRKAAEQVLQRKNRFYEQDALRNQTKKGENFTYVRVEITGVMSNDDTGEYDPALIEKQIKPSFSAVENMSFLERATYNFRRKFDPLHTAELIGDVAEYTNAASGETTENARKKLAPFREAEINELVAHSWGCELVYAAILNGDIRPPKKLIVMGVPDNDHKKWDLLAAWTGTEVHWARSENDIVKNAQDSAELIALKAAASVDFQARWKALCDVTPPNERSCHAHNRKSKPVIVEKIGKLPGVGGHSRTEYYDVLKRKGLIKDSISELRTEMVRNYQAEERRVKKAALDEAVVEARELVAQARQQVKTAQRDHDARLRNTLAEMAIRSCANPGSITQGELDRLPAPYGRDFMDTLPGGLGECSLMVYMSLGREANAEDIRRKSTLSTPEAAPQVPPPHQAIRPFPQQPTPVRSAPPPPLSTALPRFKEFATAACRAPEQVALEYFLLQPYDRSDARRDDYVAKELSAGMSGCSLRLFNALLATIRAGENGRIDRAWIRSMVAVSSAPSGTLPGDLSRGGAVPPTPDHDPVWGKIGPIIGR